MRTLVALSVLAISLVFAGCDDGRYDRAYGPPQAGAPPIGYGDQAYRDAREMGHRDGMQAAVQDMRDRRSPDAHRHDQYRHPPVNGHVRDEYRKGFQDGYGDAYRRESSAPPRYRDDDRR